MAEKLNSLPGDVRQLFLSNEPRIQLERACFLYEIEDEQLENLAEIIGNVFLGIVDFKNLPRDIMVTCNVSKPVSMGIAYYLSKDLFAKTKGYFMEFDLLFEQWNSEKSAPLISEEKAWRRVLDLEPWIEEEEKEKQKEQQEEAKQKQEEMKRFDKLPLSEALVKYPKLGEQTIAANQLQLKISSAPVRASIKNWITDYHEFAGAGKHNAFERGQYIFHGENTKKLTQIERNKLTLLLRSLDENTPVYVDSDSQTMSFVDDSQQEVLPSRRGMIYQAPSGPRAIPAQDIHERAVPQMQRTQQTPVVPTREHVSSAPFGKTTHLSAAEHLNNFVKPAPLVKDSVPAQHTQATQQQHESHGDGVVHKQLMDKLEQYFSATKKPEPQNIPMRAVSNPKPQPQAQPKLQPQEFKQPAQEQNYLERGGETIQKVVQRENMGSSVDSKSDDGIKFSSPQTFSSERKRVRPISPYHIAPHRDFGSSNGSDLNLNIFEN